jgi:vitamin B12 transporter
VRYDHHNQFGGQWSFGANGSYEFAPAWRVRASYGEGFKTPTLYQLNAFGSDFGFTFAGNPALLPERSHSYEVGVERGDRNGALHFAATAFRRDSTNLIAFVGCDTSNVGICAANPGDFTFGTYANIGKARAEGFELEFDARPADRLGVHAVYSYVKSSNLTPGDFFEGRDLARRPRHAVTFSADWRTPLHDLTIGGDIRLVSDSFDSNFSNTQLDGYVLVGVRASLPITERFEVFGRIENLTDQFYETARGYGTPGRSAYAGVRARF